jgi:hypothetical protein
MEHIGDYLHCGKVEFRAERTSLHQGNSTVDLAVRAAESIGLELVDVDYLQLIPVPGALIVRCWEKRFAVAQERERTTARSRAKGRA